MFDWYKIFNLTEFLALNFVSKDYTYVLEDRGQLTFRAVQGNTVSIVYDDVILPVEFLGANPFTFGGYSIYKDTNNDVWFGFEIEVEQ